MNDQRPTSATGRTPKRVAGRALAVVLSSVVLFAVGTAIVSARPAPVNPSAATGSATVNTSGAVTVTATGAWTWPTGTGAGELNATAGTAAQECGGDYGVGWGIVWNDTTDTGYPLTYKDKGVPFTVDVGSTTGPDSNLVGFDSSDPCGTFSAANKAVTGQWTATHTYAAGTPVPTQACVVTYVLKSAKAGHPTMFHVTTNRNNSFRAAVKKGNGSVAAFETSANCFDPASFKGAPTLVTSATNAQVGSAITDSAALAGTSQVPSPVATTPVATTAAGGTITFSLYGPSDTTCTSTPVFTSSAVTVTGDGTYGSGPVVPTEGAGTYRWVASYSGDPSNNPVSESCGASGESSTVSAAVVTSASNPPTGPSGGAAGVSTASASGTAKNSVAPVAISGATTVHTGEPWAGSRPYVLAVVAFGLSLMGLGFFERRRSALRTGLRPAVIAGD
jgi:hypothetical protein